MMLSLEFDNIYLKQLPDNLEFTDFVGSDIIAFFPSDGTGNYFE
jgi:hypothetical protein